MRIPVNSPYTITTQFGVPDSYAKFGRHSGIDYAVPLNRPVYAPTSGTLTQVVSPTGGNMVVIRDAQGLYHRLMHNNSFSRANGAVAEGQEVAKAGTTGLSTGVHVHWDINKEGVYPTTFSSFINPNEWLKGAEMPIPDQDNYYWRYGQKLASQVRGRQLTRDEFRKFIVGQSDLRAVEILSDDVEADRVQEFQQWALTNRASITKQVTDLTNKVNELTVKLQAQSENINALTQQLQTLTQENTDLKAKLAIQSEDTQLLNGFGDFLRKLITRLGLK